MCPNVCGIKVLNIMRVACYPWAISLTRDFDPVISKKLEDQGSNQGI